MICHQSIRYHLFFFQSIMDSETTLFTFLYECPSVVRTVELLGSWDNFSKPYPMERDARRSNRHWAGCYRFDDIVYDGTEEALTAKRNGGLKMGGSYWFYVSPDTSESARMSLTVSFSTASMATWKPWTNSSQGRRHVHFCPANKSTFWMCLSRLLPWKPPSIQAFLPHQSRRPLLSTRVTVTFTHVPHLLQQR